MNQHDQPPADVIVRPEWVRLPKGRKRCPYTGLSRTSLNELCLPCAANNGRPPVVSFALKRRGAKRGPRLVSYDSLMGHLEALANGQRKSGVE